MHNFKNEVLKIVNNLFLNTKDNTKFIYLKVQKELKTTEINNIEDLKNIKYVGTKIFEKIKEKLTKKNIIGNISQPEHAVSNTQILNGSYAKGNIINNAHKEEDTKTFDIKDILDDINKLSSNLSELEEKYLYSQKQTETERYYSKILNQGDLFNSNLNKEKVETSNKADNIECDIDLTKISETSEISKISKKQSKEKNTSEILHENNLKPIEIDENNIKDFSSEEISTSFRINTSLSNIKISCNNKILQEESKTNKMEECIKIDSESFIEIKSDEILTNNIINSIIEDKHSTNTHHNIYQTIPELNNFLCNNAKNKKETKKKKTEYIPAYQSAAYAIIRTLYDNYKINNSDNYKINSKNGLYKNMIAINSEKYTTTTFDTTKKFSGFNAFKTLIKRDLIYLEENKFYLTEKGIILGKKLDILGDANHSICKTLNNSQNVNLSMSQNINVESNSIQNSLTQNINLMNNNIQNFSLIIDSRERSSRDFLFFQQQFLGWNFVTRQLELGDFLWVWDENVLNYIVERKQASDFLSSTVDGRFLVQKEKLLRLTSSLLHNNLNNHFIDNNLTNNNSNNNTDISNANSFKPYNVFYIIEDRKNINSKRIQNEITKMKLIQNKEHFIVVETPNINQTVVFLKKLHLFISNEITQFININNISKNIKNTNNTSTYDMTDNNFNNFCINNNQSINSTNNYIIKKHYMDYGEFTETVSRKPSFIKENSLLFMLLKIKKVTWEKANAIVEKYKTINNFIKHMENKELFIKEVSDIHFNEEQTEIETKNLSQNKKIENSLTVNTQEHQIKNKKRIGIALATRIYSMCFVE